MTDRRALLALLLGVVWAGSPAAQGDAPGSVHGTVSVIERGLLDGRRPAADASGVIVYVTGFTSPAPDAVAVLEQRGEQFRPRVLPIVAGQRVSFPNYDRIYHNVFSVSPQHAFDLGQYRSTDPPRAVAFENPGLVPVYCNIHPHMISYVLALPNGSFATTAADGGYAIDGLPPGSYTLNAWAPGWQRVSRPLEIAESSPPVRADLTLETQRRIRPHKRKDGTPYPRPGYEAQR